MNAKEMIFGSGNPLRGMGGEGDVCHREREIQLLNALAAANCVMRSMHEIVRRRGHSTNWAPFEKLLQQLLQQQSDILNRAKPTAEQETDGTLPGHAPWVWLRPRLGFNPTELRIQNAIVGLLCPYVDDNDTAEFLAVVISTRAYTCIVGHDSGNAKKAQPDKFPSHIPVPPETILVAKEAQEN